MKSIVTVALLFSATLLSAQDWSQWRGPARTGITTTFVAPATWPERPTQAWRVQVGIGRSSPVVLIKDAETLAYWLF